MAVAYDFDEQLSVGRKGVEIVKSLLEEEGNNIVDYNDNQEQQRRGLDLFATHVGNIEVKTDTTDSDNVFLEVESMGTPGCIFKSRADWIYIVFINQGRIFRARLPKLQWWLAQHYGLLNASRMKKVVQSRRGSNTWSVTGFVVPKTVLVEEAGGEEVAYAES